MKKVFYYLVVFSVLFGGFIACEENLKDKEKELTPEELEELRRQDSLKEAQKNTINADLVLTYEVNIPISASSYGGTDLEIELNKIAQAFELTEEQVLNGIAGADGAPDITPFAIAGTTGADVGSASNTNAPWGHWWDANGDVINWGEGAMIYAEFNPETGIFHVGQFPGRLEDGQKITVIEALRYNSIRVAVQIKATAVAKEEVQASIVATQNLTLETTPKSSYDLDPVTFDLTAALTELGVSSMEGVEFVAVGAGDKITDEYTGEAALKSYWYDTNGEVCGWGDDAMVYTTYGSFEENQIGVGQFPGHLKEGDVLTVKYGLIAGSKIVVLEIKITVVGYQDPETELEGEAQNLTYDIQLSKPVSQDYASVSVDIKDKFREAFRKTTYQIHQAILSGELKLYVDEITEEAPAYTADAPEYWLNTEGKACGWSDGIVWCSIGHSETTLTLYGGNHHENAEAGNVVTTKYIATYNGGSVTFNITFTINNPEE